MALLDTDLAIDIGCSTTRIAAPRRGSLVSEPSLVAVHRSGRETGRVIAVGSEASRMCGRSPEDVAILSPMTGGVVSDFDCLDAMLQRLTPKARFALRLRRPRMFVAVPLDLSAVERRAVREVALHAGAGEVTLVPKLMAAAIGLQLPVDRPTGHFLVDLGGGTTEIGVLSVSGVVVSNTRRVGGAALDDAIVDYVRRKCNLLIGAQTAERIKIQIGSAYPSDDGEKVEVRGRDLISGVPKHIEVHSDEIREALEEPVSDIVDAVRDVLERTPPELASDLFERGILLVGGGSLLAHLDHRLREATGLAVLRAEEPLNAVVNGAARILAEPGRYERLFR